MFNFVYRKNLIILVLSAVLIFSLAVLWQGTKSFGNLACFFQKGKCLLVNLDKFTVIKKEKAESQSIQWEPDNLEQGNSGQVELVVNQEKNPPEISWPKEYILKSLKMENLGPSAMTNDNKTIWEFSFEKAAAIGEPLVAGQMPKGAKATPEKNIFWFPGQKAGWRFLITADFQKQGDNKPYTGIYGFTY